MTAEIIHLNKASVEDTNYEDFLNTLKDGNVNAVYLLEKEDGSVTIGSTFTSAKDLVFSLYKLQAVASSLVTKKEI